MIRLKLLVNQGYVGQKYDSSYKIVGKPAIYFLLPKGIRALRHQPFANPKVLKQIYSDKGRNDVHIAHRLNVFKVYVFIKQHYPGRFQLFSKTELAGWHHMPRDLADAYLKIISKTPSTSYELESTALITQALKAKEYFLSYYEPDAPTWRIRYSLGRYITYAESERWQSLSKRRLPTVLLACDNERQAKRLKSSAEKAAAASWASITFETLIIHV